MSNNNTFSEFLGEKVDETDWNSLMKVVEKIESTFHIKHGFFAVSICSNSCTIQGTKLRTDEKNFYPAYFVDTYSARSKIDAVQISCLSFINFYNHLIN